ncbi:hypothetical protein KL86SPO_70460 [uncultured Sporomusa sp.]|uniref:Uncharacterized protein n=1 Tax=uncultured Sporomusa sp. TaxID=307249 RepID=A0A212M1B4_9FIRM|nr:hypothetical protein KL86SPO_70460 [uncultured Sporomusa sp.]
MYKEERELLTGIESPGQEKILDRQSYVCNNVPNLLKMILNKILISTK